MLPSASIELSSADAGSQMMLFHISFFTGLLHFSWKVTCYLEHEKERISDPGKQQQRKDAPSYM
jgi:hypothetical protein